MIRWLIVANLTANVLQLGVSAFAAVTGDSPTTRAILIVLYSIIFMSSMLAVILESQAMIVCIKIHPRVRTISDSEN